MSYLQSSKQLFFFFFYPSDAIFCLFHPCIISTPALPVSHEEPPLCGSTKRAINFTGCCCYECHKMVITLRGYILACFSLTGPHVRCSYDTGLRLSSLIIIIIFFMCVCVCVCVCFQINPWHLVNVGKS